MSRLTTLEEGREKYRISSNYFPGPRTALAHFIFKDKYLIRVFPNANLNKIAHVFDDLKMHLENICPD